MRRLTRPSLIFAVCCWLPCKRPTEKDFSRWPQSTLLRELNSLPSSRPTSRKDLSFQLWKEGIARYTQIKSASVERRSTIRWQRRPKPLKREQPICTERESLHEECGWKGGASGDSAGEEPCQPALRELSFIAALRFAATEPRAVR